MAKKQLAGSALVGYTVSWLASVYVPVTTALLVYCPSTRVVSGDVVKCTLAPAARAPIRFGVPASFSSEVGRKAQHVDSALGKERPPKGLESASQAGAQHWHCYDGNSNDSHHGGNFLPGSASERAHIVPLSGGRNLKNS